MIQSDKILAPLHTLRRILPLLWQSSRKWTVLSTLLMALEVAFGLTALYLLKQLVDVVTELLGSDEVADGLGPVLWYVALTGGCTLAFMASRALSNLSREAQGLLVADHIDREIHARAVRADLAFYESPLYFDTLQRARQAGNQRPVQVVGNLMMLVKNSLMLAAIVVLIITINWLLLPVLLIAIVPALLVRLHFTRHFFDWQRHRTQLERRASYLDWLMTSDIHAKELRLNQLGDYLRESYADLRALIRRERMRITQRRTRVELGVASIATIAFFSALAYLAWQTAEGRNSVGDLVLFLLIFQRAQSMGQELVQQVTKLYEDHLYIGLLFEFLDIRPAIAEPEHPLPVPAQSREGIRFEQVGFHYPGTNKSVLCNIDLSIRPGQIIALVGANGSGKTSLIKLLSRLYDPTSGQITLDGVDIREYDLEEYRRVFSVIFQDYGHYATTVRDNIRFGDIRQPADTPSIEEAAVKAGADSFIQGLVHGYDTSLTRMFDDGQEISIGQWQKIALARAFMHRSSVIILDEPTSALDPGAEFELFENFRERIDHRAALIISHRLSTVRMADYIYVLDQGVIREAGTHDELIKRQGTYCELFNQQAHHYREVES
ncbi:ABC transporter permease [Litchfieldella qijiaojingensis]|uniref:ABC transporter permease n=1 Tax=Litchfieldella qijiaojingensis TaxID=980347 RepID=A0ABQ2YFD8_9GAMM|nr:ABC transporter ATP-binding protein [Halomonas qijiaojingensis]GGX80282.1 ABC transporter permease [Halomonas qijiaojingensis]